MNTKEYWHEMVTETSWQKLQELAKEYKFITIGGWAAWLWTKQHKSRGIDIIVEYKELELLKNKYPVEKNDRLKKYEIKMNEFDVDIYTPYYSKLELPIEEIIKEKTIIQGITTIMPEALLVLKQGAETARKDTTKGQKDIIDILSLLIYSPFNFGKYSALIKKYKKEHLQKELLREIQQFDVRDSEKYLGIKYIDFIKKKKELIQAAKQLQVQQHQK